MQQQPPPTQPLAPRQTTKPIPPPPASAHPRKRDSFAAFQRVVYPPKESCYKYVLPPPFIPSCPLLTNVTTQPPNNPPFHPRKRYEIPRGDPNARHPRPRPLPPPRGRRRGRRVQVRSGGELEVVKVAPWYSNQASDSKRGQNRCVFLFCEPRYNH